MESAARAEIEQARSRGEKTPRALIVSGHPEHFSIQVGLAAEDASGRRIATDGCDFGVSHPRIGVWYRWHGPPPSQDPREATRIALHEHRTDAHDIEDAVNMHLGRDPTLKVRPPRLAWANLIRAFREAGVAVTEDDLIAAPLTIELAPEVQAELGDNAA